MAICALLALAGCGGSEGSSSGSSGDASALRATTEPPTSRSESAKGASGPAADLAKAQNLVPKKTVPHIATPSGPPPTKRVIVRDIRKGSGAVAHTGDMVTVDFLGVYYSGKKLMSSWERHESFTFELGGGDGVLGWEHALQGMRVGGRRELIVPAQLTSRYLLPSQRRSQIYVIDLRGVE